MAYSAPNTAANWGSTLTCLGCHKGDSASGAAMATYSHGKHVNPAISTSIGCVKCHAATVSDNATVSSKVDHVDKFVTVKFNNSTTAVNGVYNGVNASTAAYKKTPGSSVGNCQNVYCHSNGTTATAPFVTMSTARWGGALGANCTGCHGGDNTRPVNRQMASGKHAKHIAAGSGNYSFGCADCHNGTASGNTAISTPANHVNYKIDVAMSTTYGGSYSASGHKPGAAVGTCSTVYCHSDGKATAPTYKTVAWDAAALNCAGCHGDAASNTLSGKHQAHVNNAGVIGTNFGCVDCHALTVSNNTTISSAAKHVNKFRDYSGAKARGSANYVTTTGVCSNLYCHSDGKGISKSMAAAGWNSAALLDCKGCHGSAGAPAFVSKAGEPNYTSGTAGSATANSHEKHVGGAADCIKCHTKTTATGTSIIAGSPEHVDGNIDARFSKVSSFTNFSGAYNKTSKTCSATYCHAGSTPQWGANGTLNCASCHKADSTLPGKHNKHYESATVAGSYTATPGNNGTAGQYQFQCSSCHGLSISNHASGPVSASAAGEIFFGYSAAGKRGTYTYGGTVTLDGSLNWTNGACANTYCHSNGAGAAGNNTTFTWSAASPTLGCADCHGNATSAGAQALSGRHDKHVNNAAYLGTNFGCADCHAKTVSSNTAIADKTRHVNKFKDYSGVRAGRNANCSNIYCHSNGKAGTAVAANATPPAWTSTPNPLSCKSCHGINTGGFTSQFGEPNYASGTAGSATANSHQKHVSGAVDCVKCHAKTTASGTSIIAGSVDHVDGNIDARFSKVSSFTNFSGAFNKTSKTCSATYCHGGSSPQWGASGSLNCASCHANQGAGTQAATLNGAHSKHSDWETSKYNYACEICHSIKATTPAQHAAGPVTANQAAEVVFYNGAFTNWTSTSYGDETAKKYRYRALNASPYGAAVPAPTYSVGGTSAGTDNGFSWTAGTCSAVWCHSNANPQGGTNSYQASLAWSAGSLACTACHGGTTGTGGTGLSAIHGKHISGGAGFGYTCDKCHVNTTAAGSNGTLNATTGIQYHVNATKDVNFDSYNPGAGYASLTCSTVYCHSDGKGTYAANVRWDNASSGACGSCHATTPGIGGLALISSNAHFEHFSSSYGPKLSKATVAGCQSCHTYTAENAASHVNKTLEAPLANCATSCHRQMASIQWDNNKVSCESCHTGTLSIISGITAPGKASFAGYGHGKIAGGLLGKNCIDCHDRTSRHISGTLGDSNRVLSGMGTGDATQACTYCHNDAAKVTNPLFRNMSTHFLVLDGPQAMLCQQCHDPHGATGNLSMISGKIKYGTYSATISYTNISTGMINTQNNRGLCQVCHSQTRFFKSGIAESGHPTKNCFSCHFHNGKGGAFKPSGGCDACHGYPPVPRQTVTAFTFGRLGNYTSAKFEDYSGGGGAHVVEAHVPKAAKASDGWAPCTSCHNSGDSAHTMITPIRSNVSNVSVSLKQNYKKFKTAQFITYSGAKLVNPPAVNKTGSCYNISCHFKPSPDWSTER
ncbi:MAG: cytochrome C family [Geobacteraceae bacterium]|nr:MAG: cytochrome C family [Geobacteraceae bacterium]